MATTCKTGPNYSDGGQKPVMKMKAPVQVSDEACHFEASRNQKIRKRITAFLPGRAGHKAWRVIVTTAPSTASAGPREKQITDASHVNIRTNKRTQPECCPSAKVLLLIDFTCFHPTPSLRLLHAARSRPEIDHRPLDSMLRRTTATDRVSINFVF